MEDEGLSRMFLEVERRLGLRSRRKASSSLWPFIVGFMMIGIAGNEQRISF